MKSLLSLQRRTFNDRQREWCLWRTGKTVWQRFRFKMIFKMGFSLIIRWMSVNKWTAEQVFGSCMGVGWDRKECMSVQVCMCVCAQKKKKKKKRQMKKSKLISLIISGIEEQRPWPGRAALLFIWGTALGTERGVDNLQLASGHAHTYTLSQMWRAAQLTLAYHTNE